MRFFAAFAVALALVSTASAAPRVVATVAPLHGLVSAVMQGAGAPDLAIPAAASPHDHALKPSQARALEGADLVFTVGAGLEGGIEAALADLAGGARVLALGELPGLDPLPLDAAHGDDEAHGAIDPHLWLDPAVAVRWLDAIAAALANADPANATLYRDNAGAAAAGIAELTEEIEALLAPVRGRDYAVVHDAYRYFERRFGLSPSARLTAGAAHLAGARAVADFRDRLAGLPGPCLFAEPQQDAAVVESLARDTGARPATLDPLGREIAPGPGFYPALLRALAADLAACLGNSP